jgi:2-oxoglutarate dehydrogenase E2 component (dihydrolipoamide succinyltransferase)
MSTPITVPALGESITEAIVARWMKQPGDSVAADEPIVELETDKITVEVPAPAAGVLAKQSANVEDVVNVGDVIGEISAGAVVAATPASAPAAAGGGNGAPAPGIAAAAVAAAMPAPASVAAMPAAINEADRTGVDLSSVEGTGRGGRILKEDVQAAAAQPAAPTETQAEPPPAAPAPRAEPASAPPAAAVTAKPTPRTAPAATPATPGEREERVRMTTLRRRIAGRLVEAQQNAAILTTFNEADMSAVMALRKQFKQPFLDKHGVKLGFMSFFVKAAVEALKAFPTVNAEIDGEDVIYKKYYDIGVAVGGGKGLVVPVVRNSDQLSFAAIESEIGRLAELARTNKLQISDLTGGSFTISNGGVYGSMLSTPILNPPQTGILGLHNIVQRPVAVNGNVEIRPVMYLALSYDHRLVDGREAVGFLVKIKECIEDPRRLMLEV